MTGLQIGRSATRDHLFLFLNQLLLVGVGGADAANDLRHPLAKELVLGGSERAQGRGGEFLGRDAFLLNRRQERVGPAAARHQHFRCRHSCCRRERPPGFKQVVADRIAADLTQRANSFDHQRLRIRVADEFEQRLARRLVLQRSGGGHRFCALFDRQARIVD